VARTAAAASAPPKPHPLGFNLAAIALCVALGGLALAYGLDTLGRAHRSQLSAEAEMPVVRTVAGRELSVPRMFLRYDEPAAATGFSDELDLRLKLPLGPDGATRAIDLTLIPRSKARPSAALLDGVYLHQFTDKEVAGPPGLIGKPLTGTDGYKGETVWYDAISPDPFVAKCQEPVSEGQSGRCLRTVFFDTVAGIYAFDADVLANWRDFDHEAETILASIGVRRTR
jgi:hypothetical protein